MKLGNYIWILFLSLSAQDISASLAEYVIRGELINYTKEQIEDLEIAAHKVLPSGQKTEKVFVSEDGSFQITGVKYLDLNQIWLSIGDFYYGEILVSKELGIQIDVDKLSDHKVRFYGEGVSFSGTDAEATIIANQWTLHERGNQLNLNRQMQNSSSSELPLQDKVDTLREVFLEYDRLKSEFMDNHQSEVIWIVEDKLKSEYFNELFLLSLYHKTDWDLYTQAISHQPRIMGNAGNLFYLYQGYFLKQTEIGKNIDELYQNMIENLLKINSSNRNYVILASIPDDLNSRKKYLDMFLPLTTEKWAEEYLQNVLISTQTQIEEINNNLAKSRELSVNSEIGRSHKEFPFGAQTYISEEEDVVSFLAGLQQKFKGKILIVDIWATWCMPCIGDMKDSKAIKEQLVEHNIEVVYVCTDQGSSVETWNRRIAETKARGTHIYINNELTTSLMQEFDLSGYPSYLVFDKEGIYHKGLVQRISNIDIKHLEKEVGN